MVAVFTVHSEAIDGIWIWILVFTLEWELFDRKSIDFKLHFITFQIEIALWFCYGMTILEHWATKPTPPPPAPVVYGNFIQIRFNRSYKSYSIEVWARENAKFPILIDLFINFVLHLINFRSKTSIFSKADVQSKLKQTSKFIFSIIEMLTFTSILLTQYTTEILNRANWFENPKGIQTDATREEYEKRNW